MSKYCLPYVSGKVGRPKVVIELAQLQLLVNLKYTISQMAQRFGCSTSVVKKSLHKTGIGIHNQYSAMSEEQVDEHVKQLHDNHPNAGHKVLLMVCYIKERMSMEGHSHQIRKAYTC